MTSTTVQRTKRRQPFNGLGILMALPAIALLAVFLIWPVFVAGEYSTTSATGFGDKDFVGFDNFARLFADQRFYAALGRNVIFAAVVVAGSVVIGFVLAYLLFLRVRGWRAFQVLFMIPYITPVVVTALLWQFMLEPTNGLVNTALRSIGLDALAGPWLTGEATALGSVSLVQIWVTVPFAMLLIFGSMIALPEEILEAAELDGAGHLRRMFGIVLPMLRSTIVLVVIVLTVQLFRSFDLVFLLTKGGPIGSTTIATLYVFVTGFVNNEYGYANAIGIVLGLILVAAAVVPRIVGRIRKVRVAERQEP
jgi:ABC-type sugar transport system permease subunit